jgi:hypothetical protein
MRSSWITRSDKRAKFKTHQALLITSTEKKSWLVVRLTSGCVQCQHRSISLAPICCALESTTKVPRTLFSHRWNPRKGETRPRRMTRVQLVRIAVDYNNVTHVNISTWLASLQRGKRRKNISVEFGGSESGNELSIIWCRFAAELVMETRFRINYWFSKATHHLGFAFVHRTRCRFRSRRAIYSLMHIYNPRESRLLLRAVYPSFYCLLSANFENFFLFSSCFEAREMIFCDAVFKTLQCETKQSTINNLPGSESITNSVFTFYRVG